MNNSQSSDVFSISSDDLHDVFATKKSYELLLSNIKISGNRSANLTSHSQFLQMLEDCNCCIQQCFDIINGLLDELKLHKSTVYGLIEDAVSILQILAELLKKTTTNFNCCTVKAFPTLTSNIILAVFTHCKNSECIYGQNLNMMEQQLKDLFRSCHELQLTYIMALEKHYTFDLDNSDELNILIETLHINLQICEVVQDLDVKTMAEQWKGYTMLCEKYSKNLSHSNVINKCIDLLVSTAKNNMKTAFEADEEDKVVLKSLKVASFALKIMFKISNLFTLTSDNYETIVKLFLYILSSRANEWNEKSPMIINLLEMQIIIPMDSYLKQLVIDKQFLYYIVNVKMEALDGLEQLGYTILVTSIMKNYPQIHTLRGMKNEIMECIFKALSHCHIWFNKRLKFKCELNNGKCCGLYEYLLVHSVAFTKAFDSEGYTILEKDLYENVLGTDYYSASFSSNLWVILSRNNVQLLSNTLVNVLRIYQKLEKTNSFVHSPQELHLRFTIAKFFESASYEDKILIYRQFNVLDEANYNVWCALKINQLPDNIRVTAEKIIIEKCLQFYRQFFNRQNIDANDIYKAIQNMKLLSTCTYEDCDLSAIEDILTRGWLTACPNDNNFLDKNLHMGSLWYFQYVEALAVWTNGYMHNICSSTNVAKILHVISQILRVGNTEIKILLIKLIFKLLQSDIENQNCLNDATSKDTLEFLFEDDDVLDHLFSIFVSDENYNHTFLQILIKYNCEVTRRRYLSYKNSLFKHLEWEARWEMSKDLTFIHKCMNPYEQESEMKKSHSNFDLMDVDSLFVESEQPASKKQKIDGSELEDLIQRLESDSSHLFQYKESIQRDDFRNRIRDVYNKLKDVIS